MTEETTDKVNIPYVNIYKRPFFKRKKGCPLQGVDVDYKNLAVLFKYISERGRILPSRITSISRKKQRELSIAIKRARILALLPYANI